MSYEICYSRNFIKTHRGIIPLVLAGSNNCTEFKHGGERRERDWCVFYGNKHIEKSASDLLAQFEKKDNDDFCKFRGKWLTFKDAYNFYKLGIKNALYLEDYLRDGLYRNTKGHTYHISNLRCYISDWSEGYEKHKLLLERDITTTADLEAWLDEARALIGDVKEKYICLRFNDNEAISVKKQADIKGACVIKDKKWYLSTSDADKWTCVRDLQDALIFESGEQAQKHIEAMRDKWGSYSVDRLKIVKYNANTKTPVKNCYVKIDGYGIFARFSKYGYRYSYCLCDEFKMTEAKAKKVVEKLRSLFGDKRTFEIVKEDAQ